MGRLALCPFFNGQVSLLLVFSWLYFIAMTLYFIAMTRGVQLSCDVIAEILAQLPVKSLLRFNCVSKTWYSLISDPLFSNSLHRRQPSFLIRDSSGFFSTITIESLLKDRTLTHRSLPWETKPNGSCPETICLGSCNGLVCVGRRSSSRDSSRDFIIWNPSTRKFRTLPRPRGDCSFSIAYNLQTFVWFGYDESIDDYKLLRLHLGPTRAAELDVFTLRSSTWRRSSVERIAVVGLPSLRPATGVLSNGAIHWIARDCVSSQICILVLDLAATEKKLRVLEFPHAPLNLASRIGSLEGGCLCLCTDASYHDGFRSSESDLWIMKEYGVDSSWTKVLSIPVHPAYRDVISPIRLSKEGKDMVLICTISTGAHGRYIVKFRAEEGGKVNEETVLHSLRNPLSSNIILYMEESVVSISPSKSFRRRKMQKKKYMLNGIL